MLSIPFVAQRSDLAGKFCKVLVGPAPVVTDDLQQALAHVGQPVIGRAGAHGLGGFRLMIFWVLPTSAQATRPSAAIQIEPL